MYLEESPKNPHVIASPESSSGKLFFLSASISKAGMLCGEALEISSPAMEDEDDCRRATLRCKDRRCPLSLLLPARQTRGEELHNALLSGDVGAKSGAEHGGDQAARCVEAEVHWNTCASATKSAMLVTHLARFSPLEVIPNDLPFRSPAVYSRIRDSGTRTCKRWCGRQSPFCSSENTLGGRCPPPRHNPRHLVTPNRGRAWLVSDWLGTRRLIARFARLQQYRT